MYSLHIPKDVALRTYHLLTLTHLSSHLADFVNYTQGLIQGIEYKSFPKFEDKIVDIRDVNMDDLMARIRHHALTKRLRVCVT